MTVKVKQRYEEESGSIRVVVAVKGNDVTYVFEGGDKNDKRTETVEQFLDIVSPIEGE